MAYAIGNFDYVALTTNTTPSYRVYTPKNKASLGAFALKVAEDAINLFSRMWNFTYAFQKVDQIAVPAIVQDAMENWG